MEEFDYINQLLPFYIDLLTDKQKEILQMYYYENYSLSEISEILKISRNAVFDSIKKSVALIKKYESILHLEENYVTRIAYYKQLQSLADKQVDDIVKKLLDLEG